MGQTQVGRRFPAWAPSTHPEVAQDVPRAGTWLGPCRASAAAAGWVPHVTSLRVQPQAGLWVGGWVGVGTGTPYSQLGPSSWSRAGRVYRHIWKIRWARRKMMLVPSRALRMRVV